MTQPGRGHGDPLQAAARKLGPRAPSRAVICGQCAHEVTVTAEVGRPPTAVPTTADPSAGLSAAEAARRLAEVGRNEPRRAEATPPWPILADQLTSRWCC